MQQGVKRVDACPSVCLSVDKNIERKTNNQLKYVVIHSEKGTITTFELFLEGYNADSAIYDLLDLQIQSFLISYYMYIPCLLHPSSTYMNIRTKHVAY